MGSRHEPETHASPKLPKVVICGGGIIGASTAYYLSQLGVASTIVEREDIACAASGKAGGFLALDWCDDSPLGELARKSFALHAELAAKLGAEAIGYRRVHTLQVTGKEARGSSGSKAVRRQPSRLLPSWLDGDITSAAELGDPNTTAQVHPRRLTSALVAAACAAKEPGAGAGAEVVRGAVCGLEFGPGNKVTGVRLEGRPDPLPADAAVIATGPWSGDARTWLPGLPQVTGEKAHSVVLRPSFPVPTPHMLFTRFTTASGRRVEREVYPRPDGTVYVCGEGEPSAPLSQTSSAVEVREELCDNIINVASSLASQLRGAEVVAKQACYLPCSPDGLPVVGVVLGHPGVYVATGHTCWGILTGPATGLAELIVHGHAKSVNIDAFNTTRFSPGT